MIYKGGMDTGKCGRCLGKPSLEMEKINSTCYSDVYEVWCSM